MTLPQVVQAAMDLLDVTLRETGSWQTIRAELHRLSEIAEGVEPLVIRIGEVTTRLEAANALLRRHQAADVDAITTLYCDTATHLKGAGDE